MADKKPVPRRLQNFIENYRLFGEVVCDVCKKTKELRHAQNHLHKTMVICVPCLNQIPSIDEEVETATSTT